MATSAPTITFATGNKKKLEEVGLAVADMPEVRMC
jgi:hypothetical protein